jgi:hypothetical protein
LTIFVFFKRCLIGLKFRIFVLEIGSDRVNKIDKYFENIDTKMYVNIKCLNVKYFRHSLAFFRMYDRIDSFCFFKALADRLVGTSAF